MLQRIKNNLAKKDGMTLVEVLTALTILTLIIFCFAPLFATNLKTIRTSGDKAVSVYKNAGIMQKVLGNFETGDENSNFGYDVDVANVSMTLTGSNNNGFYTTTAVGDVLVSDPTSIEDGFQTVMTNSPTTCFQVFPYEITDDFKEAYLTVAAIGTTFVDEPESSSAYKLYVNKNGTKTQLVRGRDYAIKRAATSSEAAKNKILIVTLYGGSDISFENSPLTFEYKSLYKEIQISAPSMIFVGEDATENHYYVSRGEVDEDGNLILLRRTMNNVPMSSAMNDVEWISADDNVHPYTGNALNYGSYVMCGDNGQIRRFWRQNSGSSKGNYYWDGDYTYYTDINIDEVNTSNSYETYALTKSTNVSYKYLYHGISPAYNSSASGYVIDQHTDTSETIYIGNIISATALEGMTAKRANSAMFFNSDGKVFYWFGTQQDSYKTDGTATNLASYQSWLKSSGYEGIDFYSETNQDFNWFKATDLFSGYTALTGESTTPITLTSVDCIVISQESGVPSNLISISNSANKSANGINATGIDYPNKTYVLYCGYIPAAYDYWESESYIEKYSTRRLYSNNDEYSSGVPTTKASGSSIESLRYNTNGYDTSGAYQGVRFKGTVGIAAYATSGTSVASNVVYSGAKKYILDYSSTHTTGVWPFKKTYYDKSVIRYFPYINMNYAIIGKTWDKSTLTSTLEKEIKNSDKLISAELIPQLRYYGTMVGAYNKIAGVTFSLSEPYSNKQINWTGGQVKDVTVSYYSHPLAIHLKANPSEVFKPTGSEAINTSLSWANAAMNTLGAVFTNDTCVTIGNNTAKETDGWQVIYYEPSREMMTFLDSASTKVPSGEYDVPVSLMVGYVPSGTVQFGKARSTQLLSVEIFPEAFVNSVFNNGIVMLRAGTANVKQSSDVSYSSTGEYYTTDDDGFKLQTQTNTFHQFYYLNSRASSYDWSDGSPGSTYPKDPSNVPWYPVVKIGAISTEAGVSSFGKMFGAVYWSNNAHIKLVSMDGGVPGEGYNYLRCHPMSDTEVNCVSWGTTWNNYPEAMWGTSTGDLFSWWVDLQTDADSYSADDNNDKSVECEFQSYSWIDTVNGKTFPTNHADVIYKVDAGTIGVNGETFSNGSYKFIDFYDKTTQVQFANGQTSALNTAFVSILDGVNDVEYANDIWVAVGNQSGHHPKDYCGTGSRIYGDTTIQAYSSASDGSWVNVRYFADNGEGQPGDTNCTYFWKAVRVTTEQYVNFTQINNCNGVWYATGYKDTNHNGEYDTGEKAVICRASDPTLDCGSGQAGCWNDNTVFYEFSTTADSNYVTVNPEKINSVACRDDL